MKKVYFLLVFLFIVFAAFSSFYVSKSLADESQSSSNGCSGSQSGTNNNNNCNQQNQNQNQDQTQNNNQTVNITLNQPVTPVLYAVARPVVKLPSTGTPLIFWGVISSAASLGVFLRRFTKK
ncbi:MAG: hypothetical protein KGJ07_09545 [Patescibacteria group bacterium]|nr:hypothetical protein [Patescibacteria group bacterium]